MPHAGIENFVNLAAGCNKEIFVFVQPIWLRYDTYEPTTIMPDMFDYDAITGQALLKEAEADFSGQ